MFSPIRLALGFFLTGARNLSSEGPGCPETRVPRAGPRDFTKQSQSLAKQSHAKPTFPKQRRGSPRFLFSKAKQSKAKQSEAKLSRAKQSNVKQSKAKQRKAKQRKAK